MDLNHYDSKGNLVGRTLSDRERDEEQIAKQLDYERFKNRGLSRRGQRSEARVWSVTLIILGLVFGGALGNRGNEAVASAVFFVALAVAVVLFIWGETRVLFR